MLTCICLVDFDEVVVGLVVEVALRFGQRNGNVKQAPLEQNVQLALEIFLDQLVQLCQGRRRTGGGEGVMVSIRGTKHKQTSNQQNKQTNNQTTNPTNLAVAGDDVQSAPLAVDVGDVVEAGRECHKLVHHVDNGDGLDLLSACHNDKVVAEPAQHALVPLKDQRGAAALGKVRV